MPEVPNEPKYDTTTARVFYRLRDLFLQKGSVYTAKSLKFVPVGVGLLVALTLIGAVLYRLSEPMGHGRPPAPALPVTTPEATTIRREPAAEEKSPWPSPEEILRRLASQAPTSAPEPASPDHPAASERDPLGERPSDTAVGMPSAGTPMNGPTAERPPGSEPPESSKVFERPLGEARAAKENPDYEYVSRMAAETPTPVTPTKAPGGVAPPAAPTAQRSLFLEVRARLLSRIDTSLPQSIVVAEVARDYERAGWPLRRGDLLIGHVSAASPKRVSVAFNRLIDRDRREHAVEAQAADLAGATGLPAKPADSKMKRGLLYANDKALDYVRGFLSKIVQAQLEVNERPTLENLRAYYLLRSRVENLLRSQPAGSRAGDGLQWILAHPREHLQKISSILDPLFEKLTAADIGHTLSPTAADWTRGEVFDYERILKQSLVCYVNTGSLALGDTGYTIAKLWLQDFVSFIGRHYAYGKTLGQPITVVIDEFGNVASRASVDLLNNYVQGERAALVILSSFYPIRQFLRGEQVALPENIALYNLLRDRGVVEANAPGRVVKRLHVHVGDWQAANLTAIVLPAARLFTDEERRALRTDVTFEERTEPSAPNGAASDEAASTTRAGPPPDNPGVLRF